jgi:Uma2 family endonuclease
MSTVLRPHAKPAAHDEPTQHLVLSPADWEMYEKMLEVVGERHIRVTFDGESLEVMTLSAPHEFYKTLFGRLFDILTSELDIPIKAFGSTTFRRRAKQRGLEPDQCYYMASIARIGDWRTLGPKGPVPDLAIEIDVTRSSLDRLSVYAGLGVPEVWRFDGNSVEAHVLKEGCYQRGQRSAALPFVPIVEIPALIHRGAQTRDDRALLQLLREWVRTRVAPLKEAAGKRRGRSPGR